MRLQDAILAYEVMVYISKKLQGNISSIFLRLFMYQSIDV